jgi:hypothetical protein
MVWLAGGRSNSQRFLRKKIKDDGIVNTLNWRTKQNR